MPDNLFLGCFSGEVFPGNEPLKKDSRLGKQSAARFHVNQFTAVRRLGEQLSAEISHNFHLFVFICTCKEPELLSIVI